MKSMFFSHSYLLKKLINILKREMVPIEIIDVGGKRYVTVDEEIHHRLMIKDKKFFNALVSPNAFALGEAYVKGYFDISGNIKDLYEQVCSTLLGKDQPKNWLHFLTRWFLRPQKQEKENIEYHYDVPADFYRAFLGRTMGYTCGYYENDQSSLDDAQIRKMDIICKKLRLNPGENLLDIGCGWGNLAIHAAKYYEVKVFGITLSREQLRYAEKWVEKEKVSKQIELKVLNYRDLKPHRFDKISCVGMSEHVGRIHMEHFFKTVYQTLKPGGLFLQHTITTNEIRKQGYENSFLDKYMFPGGELMAENELVDIAHHTGFELINAENFRPHYVKTLNDWILRMENKKDRLLEIVSEHIFRIYYIFFIGSLVSFKQKEISLFQNLFYKTDFNNQSLNPFTSLYSNYELPTT